MHLYAFSLQKNTLVMLVFDGLMTKRPKRFEKGGLRRVAENFGGKVRLSGCKIVIDV